MLVKNGLRRRFTELFLEQPARLIIVSFFLLQILGTFLLMLPIAQIGEGSLPFFQALFTAVSATCVAGLSVHDTFLYFTDFGKAVILVLLQVGALGLVTLTASFFSLLGKKGQNRTILMAQEATDVQTILKTKNPYRFILFFTFFLELCGSIVFARYFIPLYGTGRGIFYSVFHSVSSFCNAGYDLSGVLSGGQFTSRDMYNGNPVLMLTTAFLIIIGGMGFIVWQDLYEFPKKRRLQPHSKIILTGSAFLLFGGMILFFLLENHQTASGSMGRLPEWQRPFSAFFLSANMRSAGYTSLNLASLTDASKLLGVFLMFVGAGPGSVGGGIRITTAALFFYAFRSEMKGSNEVIILKKFRVDSQTMRRSVSIFLFSLTLILFLTIILLFTEAEQLRKDQFEFLDVLFEATAAFTTTGLSTIGTKNLSFLGQISVIPFMFIGRVGLLTLALSLFSGDKLHAEKMYPDGKVLLG